MSSDPTVRVRAPGGVWQVLGVDVAPGAIPEAQTWSADQTGPTTGSFTLRRDERLPWRDLLPFTDVEVEAPGAGVVWGGRVHTATPGTDGAWSVGCKGWQFHTDDDVMRRLWVHGRLTDWRDVRDQSATPLGSYGTIITAQSGGALTFGIPANVAIPVAGSGGRAGLFLDSGETGGIERVVLDWASSNNGADGGDYRAFLLESDTDPSSTATATSITALNGGASGTFTRTLPTPRRYVTVMVQNDLGVADTPANAQWFRVTRAVIARDTAYESGGQSALRASTVVADALAFAPLLDQDTGLIDTTGLIDGGTAGIPHLTTEGGYETPRQVMQRANAYHDWLLTVTADRRVRYRERPTDPVIDVGAWSGYEFSDAGDDAEELYNRVIVAATGLAGEQTQVDRSATSPLLDLTGTTRTRILSAEAALTVTAAEVIGDAWLARRVRRPTRGTISFAGTAAARTTSGAPCVPAQLLRLPGELVRMTDRWDPDTGAWGRDAVISSVTWTPDTDQVQVVLDAPKDRLDVVLGRFAALNAARPQNY